METVIFRHKPTGAITVLGLEFLLALHQFSEDIIEFLETLALPSNVRSPGQLVNFGYILAGVIFSLLLFRVAEYLNYKLEFNPTGIVIRHFSAPRNMIKACLYADIKSVGLGKTRGVIRVDSQSGGFMEIDTNKIVDGESVVNEIARRVDGRRVQPSLFTDLYEYSRKDKAKRAFSFAAAPLIIFFFLISTFSPLAHRYIAWKTEASFGAYDVQAFSIGDDRSILAVAQDSSYSFIYQRISDRTRYYKLEERTDPIINAAADSKGMPFVFSFSQLGRLDGEKFLFSDFPGKAWGDQMVVHGANIWSIVDSYNKPDSFLYYQNLDTGENSYIPLPNDLRDPEIKMSQIKRSRDGSIMIYVHNREGANLLLFLRDNQWDERRIPLQNFFIDASMDSDGDVWALSDAHSEYFIEKYARSGLSAPQISLPHPEERYESIDVDSHGRMWLTHDDQVSVFAIAEDGTAKEVVSYSVDNSNFQEFDRKLYMSADGSLWCGGKRLVFIDTNAETLPQPLPEWFAKMEGWQLWVLFGGGAVLGIAYLIVINSLPDEKWTPPGEKESA